MKAIPEDLEDKILVYESMTDDEIFRINIVDLVTGKEKNIFTHQTQPVIIQPFEFGLTIISTEDENTMIGAFSNDNKFYGSVSIGCHYGLALGRYPEIIYGTVADKSRIFRKILEEDREDELLIEKQNLIQPVYRISFEEIIYLEEKKNKLEARTLNIHTKEDKHLINVSKNSFPLIINGKDIYYQRKDKDMYELRKINKTLTRPEIILRQKEEITGGEIHKDSLIIKMENSYGQTIFKRYDFKDKRVSRIINIPVNNYNVVGNMLLGMTEKNLIWYNILTRELNKRDIALAHENFLPLSTKYLCMTLSDDEKTHFRSYNHETKESFDLFTVRHENEGQPTGRYFLL